MAFLDWFNIMPITWLKFFLVLLGFLVVNFAVNGEIIGTAS